MAIEIKIVEEAKRPLAMHPLKFAMWLFIVTVGMLFAAWTSAYLVKRAEPGWSEIQIPSIFWINTVFIVASSVTMFWAQRAARHDRPETLKLALSITIALGLAFLIGQWMAWGKLVQLNEYFVGGNVSHSFLYVLTGIHGLHILGGLVFLIIVLILTINGRGQNAIPVVQSFEEKERVGELTEPKSHRIHPTTMLRIELCSTFWHFLDVLWLYLFIFLLVNK